MLPFLVKQIIMSLFSSNKPQNTSTESEGISKDILSQVRVMGEKSRSPLTQNSAPVNLPTSSSASANPVSNPFIHDEPIPQVEVVAAPVSAPTLGGTTQSSAINQIPAAPMPAMQDIPKPKLTSEEGHHGEHSSKIIIIGSIIAIGLILIIGIYLYLEQAKDAQLKDQAEQQAAAAESQPETQASNSETAAPALENQAFSTTRANYLSLNPETATKDSILAQIKDVEAKIMNAHMTEPVVFQITDQNNIPLAMSRFAYLMEFGPGEDILTSLDENFTLTLFVENGQVRKALATTLKGDTQNPTELLSKYELLLPATFGNLFYPSELVLPKQATFASGSYNNSVVRYANIFPDQKYSFDYILKDKQLFFGNSKDVTRKAVEVGLK